MHTFASGDAQILVQVWRLEPAVARCFGLILKSLVLRNTYTSWVQDFGLNVDMAMYRAYDPAIGRWWQADPIAKAWENPYAAMYNNPMNWSDRLGANPSDGGMRKDTTPEKKSISWENLYVTPYQYSSDDYDESRYSVVSDSGPRDGKVAANAVINIWNGTVSMAQTVAERRVIQSVTNTVQGVYKYFKTTPASKIIDDLMNEEYADEALSFGFAASLGLARFGFVTPKRVLTGLSKRISVQKQARHLKGTAKEGGGFLDSIDDAQAVLDAVHSGKAKFLGTSKTGHQVYRFNGVTGTNVNLGAGITGQPTNVFLIKGTTSPSVVPTSPRWKL